MKIKLSRTFLNTIHWLLFQTLFIIHQYFVMNFVEVNSFARRMGAFVLVVLNCLFLDERNFRTMFRGFLLLLDYDTLTAARDGDNSSILVC